MTQKSYPWPGVASASGIDAGRYTAAEWWGRAAADMESSGVLVVSPLLRTSSDFTNVGVYYQIGNRLAVTSPANNRIDVNTGAWLNDGQIGYNDTSIGSAGNIASPTVNPRIDRVVVRKNFTGNTYNPASAGDDFNVPAYTARITIIHGAEAASPVAPSLVQDTARNPAGAFGTDGTWDIPLAQYEISTGGVISNLTDEREWVGSVEKSFFVSAELGRNTTDGITLEPEYVVTVEKAIVTPDNKDSRVYAQFSVPSDFISGLTITPIIIAPATGNARLAMETWTPASGEIYTTNNEVQATYTFAIGTILFVYDATSHAVACNIDDLVRVRFYRNGADALDTINDALYVFGFRVEYISRA